MSADRKTTTDRRTILVTGGTGTLGRELVTRFVAGGDSSVIVLSRGVAGSSAVPVDSVRQIKGNLTAGDSLGLVATDRDELALAVTDIVHCAADTTFNRALHDARLANVEGTRAILDFARACPRLERIACYSTVYVAGRVTGCFGEPDIGGDEGFVNSYEQSKAEMEGVVREAMAELPIAMYRLSTIIGDSRTGAVSGFNAVHHALRLLYQGLAPMVPGRAGALVDMIPLDFAADAAYELYERSFVPGETYHLCAGVGGSPTLGGLIDETMAAFERHRPAWRKRSIARPALVGLDTYELFVRSVEEAGNQVLLQATRAVQAFAYQLAYPKVFDARKAEAALAASGVRVPPVLEYYERVIRWCIETNWGAPA